jgi:tRNA pseudouridine-54 N-methylase
MIITTEERKEMIIDKCGKTVYTGLYEQAQPARCRVRVACRILLEDWNVSRELRPSVSVEVVLILPKPLGRRIIICESHEGPQAKGQYLSALEGVREALRLWHTTQESLKDGIPMGMLECKIQMVYRNEKGEIHV